MKFSFDENDDLVLEDIPDDMMAMSEQIAIDRGVCVEDVWRDILKQWSDQFTA